MQYVKIFLFFLIISTNAILAMESITNSGFKYEAMPSELKLLLKNNIIQNIHHNVSTPTEAHEYIVNVSNINSDFFTAINNPENTRILIDNLSKNLTTGYYSRKAIAQTINTPGAKRYIKYSEELCAENITPENISILVQQGADLNFIKTEDVHCNGTWPLYNAVVKNNYDNAKILLQLGADIDIKDYAGNYTALNAAIQNKNIELIKLLLSYNPKTIPIDQAIRINAGDEIINILIEATRKHTDQQIILNHALATSLYHNSICLQQMLDEGAQPEEVLNRTISWTLQYIINPQNTGTPPPIDTLKILCQYPITNMFNLQQARQTAENVKNMAKKIWQKRYSKFLMFIINESQEKFFIQNIIIHF